MNDGGTKGIATEDAAPNIKKVRLSGMGKNPRNGADGCIILSVEACHNPGKSKSVASVAVDGDGATCSRRTEYGDGDGEFIVRQEANIQRTKQAGRVQGITQVQRLPLLFRI